MNASLSFEESAVPLSEIIERLRAHPNIRTKTRVADLCGVKLQSLRYWTRIPAEYVLLLEEACDGAVTRYEMRPDVFGSDSNDGAISRAG